MIICLLGYPEIAEGNFFNGIAKVVYLMTDYFRKRGDTVLHYHLFSRKQYKELNSFLMNNKVDVAIWHMSTLKIKGWLHLPCPLICMWHNDPSAVLSNYDSVFCDKYNIPSFAKSVLKSSIGNKMLLSCHNIFNQLMYTYVTKCADKFVLLSDGFKKDFLPAKLFPNRVVSIPNGLVIGDSMVENNNGGLNNVLFVGRLRKEKRLDYLLKAWSIVEKNNEDWNLVVIGDGPDREQYRSLAAELALKHCEWKGWQQDPSFWMKNSKIIAMTSEYEGFGLVLVEASQFGCVPIVFDSFAAARDIITNYVNGILVKSFVINDFANELMNLMNNSVKLRMMSNEAKKNAKRYDFEEVMKRWNEMIDELVNKK